MLLLSLLLNGSRGWVACSKDLVLVVGLMMMMMMMILTEAERCRGACWAVVQA